MSATVEVLAETRRNIITIPIQAVTTRTDTTKTNTTNADEIRTLVFTTDGKYAFARDVKTGIQDNTYIEITSGLADSLKVITSPFSAISKKLKDSTLIQVVRKEDLYKEK
jgi:HlyD family secretion protein